MMWLGFLATIRLLIKAIIFSQYTVEREREREMERDSLGASKQRENN